MDFARIDTRLDAEAGASMHLTDPYEDEPLFLNEQPIEIDVLGLDSDTGRRAAARMVKALNRKTGQNRSIKTMSVDDILAAGAENEEVQSRFYAELTTGWRNITYLENSQMTDMKAEPVVLDFNPDNAFKLYNTRAWIRSKVDDFLGVKSNFKRVNAKS